METVKMNILSRDRLRFGLAALAAALTLGSGCKTGGGAASTATSAGAGVTITQSSGGKVRVNWAPNSSNQTGFRVEQSTDNVSFSVVSQVAASVGSVVITGLLPRTTYYFRVKAYNAAGESLPSPAVSVPTGSF